MVRKSQLKPKRGEIVRKGYRTKSGKYVPPTIIEDRGLPGKGPKTLPTPRDGTLSKHGYSTTKTAASRRRNLTTAINAEMRKRRISKRAAAVSVQRKLNMVASLSKNTNPATSRKFKADAQWVKSQYIK